MVKVKARLFFASFAALAAAAPMALAQAFHPSMVETGYVASDGNVTFNPPFRKPLMSHLP
jgi:hypothetical protein